MDHAAALEKLLLIEDALDQLYDDFKDPELVAVLNNISKQDADVPESKLIQRDNWNEERYGLLKRIFIISDNANEISKISDKIMKDFPGFELCA